MRILCWSYLDFLRHEMGIAHYSETTLNGLRIYMSNMHVYLRTCSPTTDVVVPQPTIIYNKRNMPFTHPPNVPRLSHTSLPHCSNFNATVWCFCLSLLLETPPRRYGWGTASSCLISRGNCRKHISKQENTRPDHRAWGLLRRPRHHHRLQRQNHSS